MVTRAQKRKFELDVSSGAKRARVQKISKDSVFRNVLKRELYGFMKKPFQDYSSPMIKGAGRIFPQPTGMEMDWDEQIALEALCKVRVVSYI